MRGQSENISYIIYYFFLETLIKNNVITHKDPKSVCMIEWSVEAIYSDLVEVANNPTKLNTYNNKYLENVLRPTLEMLCAIYLSNKDRLWSSDPVLKFHLNNGAEIHRINWMGDSSDNGMKQSLGLMVNYLYNLKNVEKNHEAFDKNMKSISSDVKNMMKKKRYLKN